jgi:hypothetical protein
VKRHPLLTNIENVGIYLNDSGARAGKN